MKSLGAALPAWMLACLPVGVARGCAQQRATTAAKSKALTQQLLVDVSVVYRSDARTGIQRVVRALLLQLLQSPPAGYVVRPVFATRQHGYSYAAPDFLAAPAAEPPLPKEAASAPVLVQVESGDLFLGLDLAAHLLPRHRAQVLSWKRAGVQLHVLVYDLLPIQHPEWFNPQTTRNFKRWVRWLATYADSAICISESVRSDLSEHLRTRFGLGHSAVPTARITLGADIAATAPSRGLPPNIEFILARLRATPSLLMVGTVEPRKGHDQVLAAFDQLQQRQALLSAQPAPILVIVGRPGWKTDALQQQLRNHPQAGKQIIWFEDASDELLIKLYKACAAIIVASRGEGFGLPLIEATAHGKSIVARDLAVFRELKLPNTRYFHGNSPEVLASAISASLKCEPDHQPTINAQAEAATWQNSAVELLASIKCKPTGQAQPTSRRAVA